jgi:shikimate dehydrogenase
MNAALRAKGIAGSYTKLAADTGQEALEVVRSLGIRGLNVTAPHKPDMLLGVDHVDPEAQRIGGANTIVNDGQTLRAFNTDHLGVVGSFADHGLTLAGRRVVLLGAGGAARGAACGLVRAGAKVTIVNRTYEKARDLAALMGCSAQPFDAMEPEVRAADVVVSSLSPHLQVVDGSWLRPGQVVFDANYKGADLYRLAQKRGCVGLSGLDWLLNQAIPAFAAFTGQSCVRGDMEPGLDSPRLDDRRPIALIGFMGAGKSTVARRLSQSLRRHLVDMDDLIEQRAGKSIPRIFAEDGEAAFRALERKALEDLVDSRDLIISCGGGIIGDADNRRTLQNKTLCIWLYASIDTVVERCAGTDRPLLAVDDPAARARELFALRRPLYAEAAHLIVSTEHPDSYRAAEKVHEEIHQTFHR